MDKKILLQELAEGVARRRDIPKRDAENFLRAVFDVLGEYLQSDKIVKIRGLGTFKLVTVDSRESVDVNTGERIMIKEYTKVNFTPDPVLRDAVNKPFAQFETVVLYEGTKVEDMERMDLPDLKEFGVEIPGISPATPEVEETFQAGADETVAEAEGEDAAKRTGEDEFDIETASIEEADEDGSMLPREEHAPEETAGGTEAEGAAETAGASSPQPENVVTVGGQGKPALGEMAEEAVAESEEKETGDHAGVSRESADGEKKQDDSVLSGRGEKSTQNQPDCGVHVETQQIEVQKVEHQTVANQHIVQMLPDSGRRRVYLTPWMIFLMVLFVMALVVASYYVGYNHLLAPGDAAKKSDAAIRRESPEAKNAPDSKENGLAGDSLPPLKSLFPWVPVCDSVKPERADTARLEEEPRRKGRVYPQVENGAYEIVGTLESHRLRRGETLRGLALKYYGSKDFTVYIVAYNRIANPDLVPEGKVLKMPLLKLKSRE